MAAKKDTPADLTLTDLNCVRAHLGELPGKVVVLNFWATWCVPYREEMPLLVQAEQTGRNKGVIFIGASLDEKDTRNAIPKFLEKYRVSFPIWTGATGDNLAKFGMGEA